MGAGGAPPAAPPQRWTRRRRRPRVPFAVGRCSSAGHSSRRGAPASREGLYRMIQSRLEYSISRPLMGRWAPQQRSAMGRCLGAGPLPVCAPGLAYFPLFSRHCAPRRRKSRCRSGVVGVDLPASSRAAPALPLVRGVVSGARASEKRHAHHAPRLTLARGERENTRETETKFYLFMPTGKDDSQPWYGVSARTRGTDARGTERNCICVGRHKGAKEKKLLVLSSLVLFPSSPLSLPQTAHRETTLTPLWAKGAAGVATQ